AAIAGLALIGVIALAGVGVFVFASSNDGAIAARTGPNDGPDAAAIGVTTTTQTTADASLGAQTTGVPLGARGDAKAGVDASLPTIDGSASTGTPKSSPVGSPC